MAIKCISKNCPFTDTDPDNCHLIDVCDFAVEQPTNADRIRAMSDDELADTMSMHTSTGACNDWGIPHEKCGGNCRECIIDWLKQPAEE